MGVGRIALNVYVWLTRRNLLKPGSVLELGSQELYIRKCAPLVDEVFEHFGVAIPPGMVSAGDMMWALGFSYESVDIDGKFGAMQLDLNGPLKFLKSYDLVTNHGTTEHCFNQDACFRTIHDACRVGGLMVHCVPNRGYDGHCFYTYKPELFDDLARANAYETVGIWTAPDVKGDGHPWDPLLQPWKRGAARDQRPGNILLSVVLRKTSKAAFRQPIQLEYEVAGE